MMFAFIKFTNLVFIALCNFPLGFLHCWDIKALNFCQTVRACYIDISLITLITLDRIYGSLILCRKNVPKEFQGNLVEIDFSLALPSGNVIKSIFVVCEIPLHQCYVVESLGKIQLCNIIHAKYAGPSRNR